MTRIYMKDIRKSGLCSSGVRTYAKKYGLDYNDFLTNGVELDSLPDQDGQIVKLIRASLEEDK